MFGLESSYLSRITPLLHFVEYCEDSGLERKVLDCGAGGRRPPLYYFHALGYEATGVEISDDAIRAAAEFYGRRGAAHRITRGDVRSLDFPDGSFSFVYSFNTVFHLSKREIEAAVREMRRVLRKNGLLYLNLLSVDDAGFGEGEEAGPGEYMDPELHVYHGDEEADAVLKGLEVLRKEKRVTESLLGGGPRAYIDYIARKPVEPA